MRVCSARPLGLSGVSSSRSVVISRSKPSVGSVGSLGLRSFFLAIFTFLDDLFNATFNLRGEVAVLARDYTGGTPVPRLSPPLRLWHAHLARDYTGGTPVPRLSPHFDCGTRILRVITGAGRPCD